MIVIVIVGDGENRIFLVGDGDSEGMVIVRGW